MCDHICAIADNAASGRCAIASRSSDQADRAFDEDEDYLVLDRALEEASQQA